MGLADRLFAPPASDAAKIERRQALLDPRLRLLIGRAGDALAEGNLPSAQHALADALAMAPGQPDVLRLYALLQAELGNVHGASVNFEAAIAAAPDDAMGYWQFAQVRERAGDIAGALRWRERAVDRLPESPLAWADLGEHRFQYQGVESSLALLERAAELAPGYAPGLFKLGNAYVACGRAEEGASKIREALEVEPAFGAAWMGLVDIKTVALTDAELGRMRELLASPQIDPGERTALGFALAMACERLGRHAEAWERLSTANARRKTELRPWSPEQFEAQERKAMEVFAAAHAEATNPALGDHVFFIVGMARSGTTLVEQILAAHPQVQGGGELPALPQVLTEESTLRQRRYPDWVPQASADDWQRLGRRYLELTADLRKERPFSTDKLPNNWRALGAIRAMLPGARIVVCRRDPLENCWSCYKQYFTQGWEFTYDIEDLATFWKAFDRAASHWADRAPQRVRQQHYETLTESPESEIRALLAFCGLPFDEACLRFHESRRSVQTLSAAQVRQPMHRHAGVAAAYGALLDPLRRALGMAPLRGIPEA
ncbi:MAG TPA: sulfotransferase [Rhodanobacteraceae bacterium]|nr:sulfotransferase [Rhodanobacteraceae bacterium]